MQRDADRDLLSWFDGACGEEGVCVLWGEGCKGRLDLGGWRTLAATSKLLASAETSSASRWAIS